MPDTKIFTIAGQQQLLDEVQVRLAEPNDLARVQSLLRRHHYLGMVRPVGERLFYVAVDGQGQWVGLLVFCAAAKYLRHRLHRCRLAGTGIDRRVGKARAGLLRQARQTQAVVRAGTARQRPA
jgi:hypothetical protein